MTDEGGPQGAAPEADPTKIADNQDTGPGARSGPFLFDQHRRELEQGSAIDPAVITERGYESIHRPSTGDDRPRKRLQALKIPDWAIGENWYFPGLLAPIYAPTGERVSVIWKPQTPITIKGKTAKYASPKGRGLRLDVHPRNTSAIADPTVELWITEGIKKGDALTSRGVCVVSLVGGVYGWRNQHGTLGDWEDVLLKGREITICYDSDARHSRNVQNAMIREGRWLKHKGARKVWYLVVPDSHNGQQTKGVDDYLAAGGTVEELRALRATAEPSIRAIQGDYFTEARMAETIAENVFLDRFAWSVGLGWLAYNGKIWTEASDVTVNEAVREYVLERFAEAAEAYKRGDVEREVVDGWHGYLGKGKILNVRDLARGLCEVRAMELDADPDLLCTPSGVVDLKTGELLPHDPDQLITKITSGSYRPGFTHRDWTKALEALPESERAWFQVLIGQGITGHTQPEGVMPVLQGSGENGKSLLTTDGLVPALGDAASVASPKLFQFSQGAEHSEERATLRGKRLLIAEELTEGRSIDVTALKQIQDVGIITARHVFQKNMSFQATHSLFTTTNYVPVVNETDWGTWRRLALIKFPFTFRKRGQPLESNSDRVGDPLLKRRIKANADNQHDAIVTWAVEGAIRWYADPATSLLPTAKVEADTRAWRVDADRILGFWDERLVADRDACVLTTEMRDAFNSWLHRNGHNEWAKELFGPRFTQHDETVRHGITTTRPQQLKGLSRSGHTAWQPPPKRPAVYQGVRFRTDVIIRRPSRAKLRLTMGNAEMDRLDRPLRNLPLIRVMGERSQKVCPVCPPRRR
jgi:putative DNA primase/helicase